MLGFENDCPRKCLTAQAKGVLCKAIYIEQRLALSATDKKAVQAVGYRCQSVESSGGVIIGTSQTRWYDRFISPTGRVNNLEDITIVQFQSNLRHCPIAQQPPQNDLLETNEEEMWFESFPLSEVCKTTGIVRGSDDGCGGKRLQQKGGSPFKCSNSICSHSI